MTSTILLIALATFIATLCGGLLALKFKDRLHLILGFSAGAVLGVAFFDLLPEAILLSAQKFDTATVTSIVALGFIIFMILDRFVILHGHHVEGNHDTNTRMSANDTNNNEEHNHDEEDHEHSQSRGNLGAGSLALHSFLDGAAIGLAFQVSLAVGAIVSVAVLVHDFSDGMNTVNVILKNKGKDKKAFLWLIVDAFAPVLGVFSTLFFTLPETALGIILAIFCGFFIYIGASDLLPESHHKHPNFLTTVMTILGMAVLYMAVKLAGI
ncbi:MAG: ZIP family metal transporter [bacterium]